MFALYITYTDTGHVKLLTFPSRFDRALWQIGLAGQPVEMTTVDY